MSTEGCIPLPFIDVLLFLVTERFFLFCDANDIDKHSDVYNSARTKDYAKTGDCGIRKQPSQYYKEGLTRSRYWLVPILCKRRVFCSS